MTEHSGRQASYTYDDLYRLTEEKIESDPAGINGMISYEYDSVGNRKTRTSAVAGVPSTMYTYDANDRLTTDTYDNNGNTTGMDGKTYTYDFENHLTEQNSGAVTIVYDGDGNRVTKTIGVITTHYLVDDRNLTGYGQVLEEIVDGSVQRVYTYGLDLISQSQASGTSFYGYDGHGNVRILTDSTGAVTDRYDYDAFGNITSQAGTTPNVYLYSGEQLDSSLGLIYLRARYLQPASGRFLSADEFEGFSFDPVSLHKYLYAHASPIDHMDPSGRLTTTELMVTQAIIAGLTNVVIGVVFNSFKPTVENVWGDFAKDFAIGALTAPVGGVIGKAVGPILRPLASRVIRAVGAMKALNLVGRPAWEKALVRVSRWFLTTTKTYPSVESTAIGRALKTLFPWVEWEQHHIFIQQAWFRSGSAAQLYDDLVANTGLQRLGNAARNLMPIPASLNGFLGRSPAVATPLFATFVYAAAVFGDLQLIDFVSEIVNEDRE